MSTARVRCNNCGLVWPEDEVPRIRIDPDTIIEGCDNCGTDDYLMDEPWTNE